MIKSVALILTLSLASGAAQAEETNPQPSEKQIQEAIKVSAMVLSEWNPRLKYEDLFEGLRNRIIEQGLEKGLLLPMMNIIDASYVIGAPSIAKVMSPSIAALAPSFGDKLNQDLGLPQRFPGSLKDAHGNLSPEGFDSIRRGVRSALPRGLGEAPRNPFRPAEGDLVEVAFSGVGSAIQAAVKAPRTVQTMGPYSQRDLVSYDSCLTRCIKESLPLASDGATAVGAMAGAIGLAVGSVTGPGAVATGTVAGIAGAGVGAAVGVATGISSCSDSPECGGPKGNRSGEEKKEKQEAGEEKDKDSEKDKNKDEREDSEKDKDAEKKEEEGVSEDKDKGEKEKKGRAVNNDERSRPKPKSREEQDRERKEKQDSVMNPARGDREPRTPEKNTQPGKESVILVTSEERLRLPKVQKKPGLDISVVLPARDRLRSGGHR